MVSFHFFVESCFQFPLQVNRIPAVINRKRRKAELSAGATDEDSESARISRDPETLFTGTSSGNSEIESPSGVPVMSVLPPTPGSSPPPLSPTPGNCTSPATTPDKSFTRKMPQVKPSSMIDVSKIPIDAIEESESLLKPITSNSSRTSTPGNMLYIPELRGRLTSAVSDSSLWNSRNKPWLGSTSPDFRGSTFLGSPGMNMQQFAQPRKSEKVAQVSVFIVLCFRLLLVAFCTG